MEHNSVVQESSLNPLDALESTSLVLPSAKDIEIIPPKSIIFEKVVLDYVAQDGGELEPCNVPDSARDETYEF